MVVASKSTADLTAFGRFEKGVAKWAEPLRPAIALIARFLLVSTFLEDSARLFWQWDDQMSYMMSSKGLNWHFSAFFLSLNVFMMLSGSAMAIVRKGTKAACFALSSVVVGQVVVYGLFSNISFVIRSASLLGAILLLLVDSMTERSKKMVFAGLPMLSEKDKGRYFAFMGRILIIALFASFALNGERTFARILVSAVAFVTCIMVVIGFKAKFSAVFLTALLSVSNVLMNNWWTLHELHPSRDFVKYDFFQTLSIVGGLLLLADSGPGSLSIDEKEERILKESSVNME